MTTDRELLELAARAIGLTLHESYDGTIQNRQILCFSHIVMGQPYGEVRWNPLGFDEQAFRIAIELGLSIRPLEKCVFVESDPETLLAFSTISEIEMYNGDKFAATRRAIVRAAAEIGRGMK